MKSCIQLFILGLFLINCGRPDAQNTKTDLQVDNNNDKNLLKSLSHQVNDALKWMNEPVDYKFKDGTLEVSAPTRSDFFNDPQTGKIVGTAPLLYLESSGDFVATALVEPDFSSLWNAASLMVYQDSTQWIKFAFENSDATGKSIVSVVTDKVSDDANGVILKDHDAIWLRIIRKQEAYAMHWSLDGERFKMARLSSLLPAEIVKIGIEVQCPVGVSANHKIHYFSLENKTTEDLRKG